MRALAITTALALASCSSHDNSPDTDRSGSALKQAQSAVSEKSSDVDSRARDIEREKRELVERQQALVADEQALKAQREDLGSARTTLLEARASYTTAVATRLSKLDAIIADLATRTDAASQDAVVGLRARRAQLAAKVATLPTTGETDWAAVTRDVDITFDAIERDLHASR